MQMHEIRRDKCLFLQNIYLISNKQFNPTNQRFYNDLVFVIQLRDNKRK